jgi:hypothetical protein
MNLKTDAGVTFVSVVQYNLHIKGYDGRIPATAHKAQNDEQIENEEKQIVSTASVLN